MKLVSSSILIHLIQLLAVPSSHGFVPYSSLAPSRIASSNSKPSFMSAVEEVRKEEEKRDVCQQL